MPYCSNIYFKGETSMRIIGIDIQNFRKLFGCHIDISKETTLFVGANNSGKTSAMEALAKIFSKIAVLFLMT